ncbi:MAG: UDP-N-acetylmuramoyl-L-alanyl-D-glutamate--2,6-diaminopimelate ligase [Clostridia bacterium]|nr:UDP-N-acetylmuramoyl-L-alanyl-D-glutamate--2,6-diaminopimelate ligase [Clostridia bacterium]
MRLSELFRGVDVVKWNVGDDIDVSHITSDSRCVLRGGMFICIKGSKTDGHRFVGEALKRGAAVIVASDETALPMGTSSIITANTRLAEAHIWNNWYSRPCDGMKTVAVTGTNGKTTTVLFLREIFRAAGKRVGIITTLKAMADDEEIGNHKLSSVSDKVCSMTTPDPEYFYGCVYLMKQKGIDTLIFEASSHALAQNKLDPIRLDMAVFTNLSREHLDYHGDMESYFGAKKHLADLAEKLTVNVDDSYMRRLANSEEFGNVTAVSADPASQGFGNADVTALCRNKLGLDGVEYVYFSKNAVFKIKSPMIGDFTVYNSLLAAAAAMRLGVEAEAVRDGIGNLRGVDGRLERVSIGRDGKQFELIVDYAHTPAALEGLLRTVRECRNKNRKITLLFGCGGERDRGKRREMGSVASRLADFVIVTSDNSRGEDADEIICEILLGIDKEKPHAVISDRRCAIEYAVRTASDGDIIVLAGKGHEKYEITNNGMLPFDEIEIARRAADKF